MFKSRAMNRYKETDMFLNPTNYMPSDKVFQKNTIPDFVDITIIFRRIIKRRIFKKFQN